jgi:tetratricopeptide (TPR) repeat protein
MKKIALATLLWIAATAHSYCSSYDEINAAISYFNQAQYDNAIVWFDKAIAAGDLIPDLQRLALLDRGAAYGAKGDIQKAITDYSAAIALQPNEILGYRQRISAYLAINDPEKAWTDYETLRKLRPLDGNFAKQQGWLSWRLNKLESCAEAFGQFSKVNVEAWIWLQLANVRLGRPASDPLNEQWTRSWPGNVARFFQGELSDAQILAEAKVKGEHDLCLANMYVGMWRAVHGDTASAETSLKGASEKCGEPYRGISRAELNKLAAGTKAE